MLITKLKSKLHRVTASETQLDYEGSCGICVRLMEAANIQEYEQLHIYNITNGERFTTYAIADDRLGSISIRGSAARKVQTGDTLIVCTYCQVPEDNEYHPITVYVDSANFQTNHLKNYRIDYFEFSSPLVTLTTTITARTGKEACALFTANPLYQDYNIRTCTDQT